MAITYIFGGIQLIATIVNLLALGAFWVTPGLRTTANKFVINLLFINIFGCLVLSPAIWMNGDFDFKLNQNISANQAMPFRVDSLNNGNIVNAWNDTEKIFTSIPMDIANKTNGRYNETNARIDCAHKHNNETKRRPTDGNSISDIIDDHMGEQFWRNNRRSSNHPNGGNDRNAARYLFSDCKHFWGLDLAAALGKIH